MILDRTKQFLSQHRGSFFWSGLVLWLVIMWLLNFDLVGAAAGFFLYVALFFAVPQKYILTASAVFGGVSLICLFINGLNSVVGNYTLVIAFFLLLAGVLVILRERLIKGPRWAIDGLSRQGTWLAIISLAFIAFFLVRPALNQPGLLFSGDFAFPFSLNNYWQDSVNTWSVSRGASVFGDLEHLFYLGPIMGLTAAVGGGMEVFLKILIVIPYLVAGLGMFFLGRRIFRENFPDLVRFRVPAALIAAAIYQINPWLLDHQPHYFLQVGYAFLPLTLLFTVIAWERKRFGWIFLAAAIFATTTVTPHYMVYTAVALAIVFLVNILADLWRRNWLVAGKRLVVTLGIIGLAVIFSSFWLWPLLRVQLQAEAPLAPDYVLRMDDISAANTQLSWSTVFQLSVPDLKNTDSHWVWQIAGFGLPVLSVAGFVLNYRRRWAIALMLLLMAAWSVPAVFIAFPGLYANMIYHLPFSWIFHDPSRTLGLVCLGYGLLAGMFLLGLVARQKARVNFSGNNAK